MNGTAAASVVGGQGYALVRTADPASEPVSLAEAMLHCRVDADLVEDGDHLNDCIRAAREYCEEALGQAFVTQSWTLYLDRFPACQEIRVPRPPLLGVTGIRYQDVGTGVLTTLSPTLYGVDTASRPGRITPAYNQAWPAARYDANSVEIAFVAGSASGAVPGVVKQAMKLLIGHWYLNREAVVTGTISTEVQFAVDALLAMAWSGSY